MLKTKNFGRKSLNEIKEILVGMGLGLGMHFDEQETLLLQDASLKLAEQGVADAAADSDRRLEHLVRGLDEARTAHNSLESNLVEWFFF